MNFSDSRLNIVSIGTLAPDGAGATLSFTELLIGLSTLGHTVRAVSPTTAKALKSGDVFADAYPQIPVRRYNMPYLEFDPFNPAPEPYRKVQYQQIAALLQVMIDEKRPDLILIGRESFVWGIPEVARAHSIPCILMARGLILAILKGLFPQILGIRLVTEARMVNLVVACAKHMASELWAMGFQRVKVIPTAVNTSLFCPGPKNGALLQELAIDNGSTILMHVSHLHPVKRPMDIVDSAAKGIKKNRKLIYVIIGDGPCRKTMELSCRERHISDNFRFLRWVDYRQMPDYFRIADIVVMPSQSEGLSRVYLEAQASGRVLLASDIPAARESILDGETGLLFRKGDIDDLAEKSLMAAENPELRNEIGRKARERAVEHNSLSKAVRAYTETFQKVIYRFPENKQLF